MKFSNLTEENINYTVIDINWKDDKKEIRKIYDHLSMYIRNNQYSDYDGAFNFSPIHGAFALGIRYGSDFQSTANYIYGSKDWKNFSIEKVADDEYIMKNKKLSDNIILNIIDKKTKLKFYITEGYICNFYKPAIEIYENDKLVSSEYWINGEYYDTKNKFDKIIKKYYLPKLRKQKIINVQK